MKIKKINLNLKMLLFPIFTIVIISLVFLKPVFAEGLMDKQAEEYFKEALESQKMGDVDLAISFYIKTLLLNPDYAKAHNNLGTAYAQKGERQKAEEEYLRAVRIDPNYTIALKNLAVMYLERKDYEKFYEYWKRATGLDIYCPFLIDDEE